MDKDGELTSLRGNFDGKLSKALGADVAAAVISSSFVSPVITIMDR